LTKRIRLVNILQVPIGLDRWALDLEADDCEASLEEAGTVLGIVASGPFS
jgi:hypothetical protein